MRKGDWLQTYTGKAFWPLDPRPEDVDIMDIAHSLAMQCRFNGRCKQFYSVAEHSIITAKFCSPENRLWGLLHDASEAYVSDVPRPLKPFIKGFKEIEDRITQVIAERFGLPWPMPAQVKEVGSRLLANEIWLMETPPMDWNVRDGFDKVWFECLNPFTARDGFLVAFSLLQWE